MDLALTLTLDFRAARQSCVGLMSWVCYTAVGLAYMPIDILKGQRHIDRLQATIEERESLLGNRYTQIREKAWRHGAASLTRRERRDAEVSEHSRCTARYSILLAAAAGLGLGCVQSQPRHSDTLELHHR